MSAAGVLILAGQTASGKTDLALSLARRFGAEIIGADSRQIYRGMPIGTAAPTAQALRTAPHHLVEFLDPHQRYSAARFVDDALAAIDAIRARGRVALVVGGTGFYLRALCGDIALGGARDEALRARLAREALVHPTEVMHGWLSALDPPRAQAIRGGDRYRVIRALEVALAARGGGTQPAGPKRTLRSEGIAYRKAYLDVPAGELERRIALRVDAMLGAGFLDEAERLGPYVVAADAVGYPHALSYLRGFATRAELRAQLIRATRRYAKRQATWFRSEPDLHRIAVDAAAFELERLASELPGWG